MGEEVCPEIGQSSHPTLSHGKSRLSFPNGGRSPEVAFGTWHSAPAGPPGKKQW